MTSSDLAQHVVNVVNPAEGRRYKVTLRGDILTLPVRKLKKYLVASSGIAPEDQLLKYNGVELGDDVLTGEVGIASGATLTIERRPAAAAPFVASPQKQALEMETLDLQRAMLHQEKSRRDENFRKQQEALHQSLSLAEQRRVELERDKHEKELELARLQELEALALAEKNRLEEVRRNEAEREALRTRDLEARKEQLNHERMQQRQLEMMRLENERKKMLLTQQKAEYEGEKARLERERKERLERIKRHELMVREKEVDLERAAIEAERQRRLLAQEKEMLEQQRQAELEMAGASVAAHKSSSNAPASIGPITPRQNRTPSGVFTPHMSNAGGAAAAVGSSSNGANSAKEAELTALRREREALLAAAQAQARNEPDELDRAIEIERAEIEALRASRTLGSSRQSTPRGGAAYPSKNPPVMIDTDSPGRSNSTPFRTEESLKHLAAEQLRHLAEDMGVPALVLDDSNTCVVSVEERYTLLITFDATTQRIYLYSTLSTFIPKSPEVKLRLYEFLLEGALLGRDMCGGGVGLSLRNDFVLLSTSIFLPKSQPTALKSITPLFVENLAKWRSQVREVLGDDGASGIYSTTTVNAAPPLNVFNQSGARPPLVGGQQQQQQRSSFNGSAVQQQPQQQHYIPEDTFDESVGSAPPGSSLGPEMPVVGIEVTEGDQSEGVIVIKVKGPAARAGILPNDVIRKVNAAPINSLRDFQLAVKALKPNAAAPFVVERARTQLLVNVLVGSTHARAGVDPRYGVVARVAAAGVADGASGRANSSASRTAPSASVARAPSFGH